MTWAWWVSIFTDSRILVETHPQKGANPFSFISYGNLGEDLSSIVKCYEPRGRNSKERYEWISEHLVNAVEEAIAIRKNN